MWNDTSGVMLGAMALTNTTYLELRNRTFAGAHSLRATYTGVAPYHLPSTATVSVDGPPADEMLTEPLSVRAVAGDGVATVSWLPPAGDGGHPITGYFRPVVGESRIGLRDDGPSRRRLTTSSMSVIHTPSGRGTRSGGGRHRHHRTRSQTQALRWRPQSAARRFPAARSRPAV